MEITYKNVAFTFLSFLFLANQNVVAQIDFEILNPSPPDAGYVNLAVLSPDHIIAITYYGAVYTTIDGGENWSSSVLSGGDQLTTITFLNQNTGYITASRVPCIKRRIVAIAGKLSMKTGMMIF